MSSFILHTPTCMKYNWTCFYKYLGHEFLVLYNSTCYPYEYACSNMLEKKQLPQAIEFSIYHNSLNASFTGKINLCWECQEYVLHCIKIMNYQICILCKDNLW